MFCPACGKEAPESTNFCQSCGQPLILAAMGPGANYIRAAAPATVKYVAFWPRFVAFMIDAIIVYIVVLGAIMVVWLSTGAKVLPYGKNPAQLFAAFASLKFLVSTVVQWLYWASMESSHTQATLGKMAMGFKVTDLQGERLSFARATGRYLGKLLSALILCIGFIMIDFTEKMQALHDIMAGTLVVKKQSLPEKLPKAPEFQQDMEVVHPE